jgi:Domain of unknown function (DUF3597)
MGILGDIFHKIFPSHQAPAAQAGTQTPAAPGGQQNVPPPPVQQAPQAQAQQPQQAPSTQNTGAAPNQQVDVEEILTTMQKQSGQQLNWRTSIVDLLKLLNLDSSLQARKALAAELHYTGDTNDSATMNIWLHKQVMTKLAQNGGKVPADLQG